MREQRRARHTFLVAWAVLVLVRLLLAARLPLFVDEAFYWQESRHLAWAYSDLPGLTAWLIRLGTALAGDSLLGVRWPFLLLAAALPWLMRAAARPLGPRRAWQVGTLVAVFPLSGLLGILALPDVPLNFAAALCLVGGVRAVQKPDWRASAWLAAGLLVGGLSHYRFLGVLGVGVLALSSLPQGRRVLREPRVWLAVGLGLLAWLPLVLWNFGHDEAGWRFQLLDRHPWQLQADGLWFPVIQALLATPLLFGALLLASGRMTARHPVWQRWFALCGGLTLLVYFLLGFVADAERVSFHWPLPGYLALLVLVPVVMSPWPAWLCRASLGLLCLGLALGVTAAAWVALPQGRAALAGSAHYPDNFAGWDVLADAVRTQLEELPPGARVLADHFKLGAELGFALGDADIRVLEHPLNQHHGRARQLEIWNLLEDGADDDAWRLLVVADSDMKLRARLPRYHALCDRFGALPEARLIEVDRGARRFFLFALAPGRAVGECIPPALVHVDSPADGEVVGRRFQLRGWAVKDGVGISHVRIRMDDGRQFEAGYGLADAWVDEFLGARSRDPNLPRVRFEAMLTLPDDVSPGRHELDLELVAGDGRVERRSGGRVWLKDVAD